LQRRLRRSVSRHRTVLVAAVLSVGVVVAVTAARPPPPESELVAVAAHDLVPGRPLTAADVRAVRIDPSAVPDGAYAPAEVPLGRLVAAPTRRGETLTDVAVLGPGLVGGLPRGSVLATVTVRAVVPGLLQVGDVVSVVATDPRGSVASQVVAEAATVMWVADVGAVGDAPDPGGGDASRLVVSVPAAEALELSALSTTQVLDILVPAAAPR